MVVVVLLSVVWALWLLVATILGRSLLVAHHVRATRAWPRCRVHRWRGVHWRCRRVLHRDQDGRQLWRRGRRGIAVGLDRGATEGQRKGPRVLPVRRRGGGRRLAMDLGRLSSIPDWKHKRRLARLLRRRGLAVCPLVGRVWRTIRVVRSPSVVDQGKASMVSVVSLRHVPRSGPRMSPARVVVSTQRRWT
jgi:hypothetical protein